MVQTVLVVEDQTSVAKALELLLQLHGVRVEHAPSPDMALAALAERSFALVIQDMNFRPGATSGEEGMELFRAIHEEHPDVPVLLVTAYTSLETAVALVREGASDYQPKPWDDAKLMASVRNLLRLSELASENKILRAQRARARTELARRHDLAGLLYASEAMHELLSLAVRVARADVPVLIAGPNGTGKEKLAEVIVANSDRRDRPFVRVNLGALPNSLLEAELFGAEAGAFTGAGKRRVGRFEAADGGTLMLDEIGTLSPSGQTRLLRVLQSGEFERLGSSTTRRADVRIIAATNADLRAAIAEGSFREDLYFRLNVIELQVPPLRERREDIALLAEHFLAARDGLADDGDDTGSVRLSGEALERLRAHSWPGNVRELENCMKRARLVATGEVIEVSDLRLEQPSPSITPAETAGDAGEAALERTRIEDLLNRHDGVLSRAAKELGLSRQALYRRMNKLGIVLERRLRD